MHRYSRSCVELVPNGMPVEAQTRLALSLDRHFRELEALAVTELSQEGVDVAHVMYRYSVEVRYIGQLESVETHLDFGRFPSAAELTKVIAAFEATYARLYPAGARFPQAGYAVTDIALQAVAPKVVPELREHDLVSAKPTDAAYVGSRKVYHDGRWTDFQVWQMGGLRAGNVVVGPAIIRDPMTTVVIPPDKRVEIDKFMVLHYR
jgi:N-methylhydantoinase A